MTRYRIVFRSESWYGVDSWRWWWPFWIDTGERATTAEGAENLARRLMNRVVKEVKP